MTPVTLTADLTYAEVGGVALKLNIYRPDLPGLVPTIIYLHGGGWRRGERTDEEQARLLPTAAHGVAIVSIDYRLAPDAVYPAQIHDTKAAIRWVRAHGAEYGLQTERLGVWGSSAGGTIGSLAALTPGDAALEGALGNDPEQSSEVQAAVHWFGPTDFVTTATRSPMEQVVLPPPYELALFGPGSDGEIRAVARLASPLGRVSSSAPPFLILHGDRDRMVPHADSQAFHNALSRAGASSTFVSVAGAGHEDPVFDRSPVLAMTAAFLIASLSPEATRAGPRALASSR